MRQICHVPRDEEQDGRQRAQRNLGSEGCERHDDEHEEQRVHDAGHRARCAVADVGGRARDGAGRCESAEERCEQVGRALTDELLVRVVSGAHHAVGDHCGQQ